MRHRDSENRKVLDAPIRRAPVEVDPTRMCELLVGLPAVNVLGVDDERSDAVVVHIESRVERRAVPCAARRWG